MLISDKKYQLIYADPPWKYDNALGDQAKYGAATSAYPTMTQKDICALPVAEIADSNCLLALWATGPKLPQALEALEAWGFEYVSVLFTWVKLRPLADVLADDDSPTFFYTDIYSGRGQYTKPNVELVLAGRKGYMPDIYDNTVRQVVIAPRGAHSEKPNGVRVRLERMLGPVSKIELFARVRHDGWDAWGNEV